MARNLAYEHIGVISLPSSDEALKPLWERFNLRHSGMLRIVYTEIKPSGENNTHADVYVMYGGSR